MVDKKEEAKRILTDEQAGIIGKYVASRLGYPNMKFFYDSTYKNESETYVTEVIEHPAYFGLFRHIIKNCTVYFKVWKNEVDYTVTIGLLYTHFPNGNNGHDMQIYIKFDPKTNNVWETN